MKSKTILSSLALTCFTTSLSLSSIHAAPGFKCYGISGPGENDCDALDHKEHTCTGESERDHHVGDWKVVTDEKECIAQKGLSEEAARKKLGLPKA